ncbi:MAG: DMT family transporter [Alphaproteobacteria bacterium]|nr:DMT family transporter [Alphaproteobacteria bacterium]
MAAAAAGIQVGAAMVATRFVVDAAGPASLAFLRYAIGFLCLVPALLASGHRLRFARADVAPIAVLGILQFGVLIALLNVGLRTVPAGRASLIFAIFPLLTMVFAAALGRERLTAAKTAGVLTTIAGVALAIGAKAVVPGGDASWSGEAIVLASAATGAVCTVLYRPYLGRYPTLAVGAFAMLASVGFLAILAAAEGFFTNLPRLTWGGWLAVLFIGVGSGAGYYLWLWALGRTTPTRVTAFLGLGPVTAVLAGAALLGEPVGALPLLGLACVVLGLWLAHREIAPKKAAAARSCQGTALPRP